VSTDFIVVSTIVYHGEPKPAKHLCEGEHILFGGKVWIVADANFKKEAKYPNDLEINLYSITAKLGTAKQTIIVDRDFEMQPLVVSVIPKTGLEKDEAEEPAVDEPAQG
jgi:hypothetical protein